MPTELSPIKVFSPRGQCIVLLFAALRELGVTSTRRQVVAFIDTQHWFAKEEEDLKPYPSQVEPRWKTLLAWGRKDAVLRTWGLNHERDGWAISREGHRIWDRAHRKFTSHEWQVSLGYLWTPKFKNYLCQDYKQSASDLRRPLRFYEDVSGLDKLVGMLSRASGPEEIAAISASLARVEKPTAKLDVQ